MNKLHRKLLLLKIIISLDNDVNDVPRFKAPKDRVLRDSPLCIKQRLSKHSLKLLFIKLLSALVIAFELLETRLLGKLIGFFLGVNLVKPFLGQGF